MTTARDVIIKTVCHNEQLEIWADEFLEHFIAGDFLRQPENYEDKISLIRTVKDAIEDLIEKVFDHPELQTDSVRLELATLLNPWRPIETAPKDQPILAFMWGAWRVAQWNFDKFGRKPRPFWDAHGCIPSDSRGHQPKWWLPLPAPPSEDK